MLYIYRNCFMIESIQVDEREQSAIHGLGADISLPQLGSKSDYWAKITGSILWYNALVPCPEVLRLISCLNANPERKKLFLRRCNTSRSNLLGKKKKLSWALFLFTSTIPIYS